MSETVEGAVKITFTGDSSQVIQEIAKFTGSLANVEKRATATNAAVTSAANESEKAFSKFRQQSSAVAASGCGSATLRWQRGASGGCGFDHGLRCDVRSVKAGKRQTFAGTCRRWTGTPAALFQRHSGV
jgi:hypothetical protein